MKNLKNNFISCLDFVGEFFSRMHFNRMSYRFSKLYQNPFVIFFNDTLSNQINIYGRHEFEILDFIKKKIIEKKRNRIFLDIGANIGNHSLNLQEYFTKIICFEPHPIIFSILKLNLGYFDNIKLLNLGLSNKRSSGIMLKKQLNMAGINANNIFFNKKNKKNIYYKIKLDKLDNLLSEYTHLKKKNTIDLIKIDIEGSELKALEGMQKILKNNSAYIFLESNIKTFDSSVEIKLLKKLDYKYFYCLQSNKTEVRFRNLILTLIKTLILGRKKLQTALFDIEGLSNIKNYNFFYNDLVICSKERL
jgi:FkbM family methyltransferase